MSKPTVFNYQGYVNLMRDYNVLYDRYCELEREVEKLRNDKTNLEIRCRILEADRCKSEATK